MKGGEKLSKTRVVKKEYKHIPIIFQELDTVDSQDSRFLKVKIWLMHTGENYNGSYFSKEAVEKAIPTLANTPILAFIEENESGEKDYSDHRIVLERTKDGEYRFRYLGSAIGVIPENHNAKWETRVTDSGEEKLYLTCEGLLWKKWDDPIDILKRRNKVAQSMELSDDYSGYFDENGLFHFEEFSFFGVCLLGEGVEPAMENASAEIVFSQNNIQKIIQEKLTEYYSLLSKGGNQVPKEMENQQEVEQKDETVDASVEEQKDVQDVKVQPEPQETQTEGQADNKQEPQTNESVCDCEGGCDCGKSQNYDCEDKQEQHGDEPNYKEEFTKLSKSYKDLEEKLSALEEELQELRSYKRTREEADLRAKFAGQLTEEEMDKVFTEMSDVSTQEIEEQLFALVGKKNFSRQKGQKNTNKVAIIHPVDDNDKPVSPYGNLFD